MISQLELVGGICKLVSEECPTLNPRQMNAIARGADMILEELRQPDRPSVAASGMEAWLKSDDTGMSSRYMAFTIGTGPPAEYAHPWDPSDLGRCLRLLEACPELRPLVPAMAKTGKEWKALVEHWDELEALYREELPTGRAPKLYDLMQKLLRGKS